VTSAVANLASLAGTGHAFQPQDAPAAPPLPTPSTTVLVVEHAGLDRLLVDAKDQGLARALGMMTARIDELPGEIPDMDASIARTINLALRTVTKPTRFAATYTSGAPLGGFYNYGLQLSVLMDSKAQADELQQKLQGLMDLSDLRLNLKPSTRFPAMLEGPAGIGTLAMGPRAAGAEGAGPWRYEMHFGTIGEPDAASASLPAITGMNPTIRARLDLSGLTPAVKMLQGMANNEPEALEMIGLARTYGLYGPTGIKAQFASGYTETHAVSRLVIENAAEYKDRWYLHEGSISAEAIRAIPSDCVTATMLRADFDWLNDLINFGKAQQPDLIDALEEFQEFTGVELQSDLIANIGGTVGYYQSFSTGGGGVLSSVLLVSFKNRDKFVAAHDKLVRLAHNLADEHLPIGPGYIRFTPWTDGETTLLSLRFNGLPVPLELTYAPLKDWLVISLTPQGAMVAARQASGKGDAGLRAHPTLGPAMAALPASVTGFSVTDTRAKVADGYGLVSLMGSAIANMVRSPRDPASREPGFVVPPYNELVKDVKPSLLWMTWDDGQYVIESKGDRSWLVQITASLGGFASQMGNLLPAMMPAIGEALDDMAMHTGWPVGEMAGLIRAREEAWVHDPLAWMAGRMMPTIARPMPIVAIHPGR
jgi:hypothetical protein